MIIPEECKTKYRLNIKLNEDKIVKDSEYNLDSIKKAINKLLEIRHMEIDEDGWTSKCMNEEAESLITTLLNQPWFKEYGISLKKWNLKKNSISNYL